MNILELAQSSRPRERLMEKGASSLSDAELVALILRTGNKEENVLQVSELILSKYSLSELSRISPSALSEFNGIGEVKASQLIASFELARRLFSNKEGEKKTFHSAEDVAAYFMPKLSFLKNENLHVLYLDVRKRIIKEELISAGILDAMVFSPRDIFHHAVIEKARAIVLVHNHPSGDPSPSEEDIETTKELCSAGALLGIDVLDHVIIGNGKYCSLREMNLIE